MAADADPVVPTPKSVENLEYFNWYVSQTAPACAPRPLLCSNRHLSTVSFTRRIASSLSFCYVMDVVNTLWRSRALAQKEGEQSCLMDEVECRRRAILGSATVKTADEETRDLLDKLRAGFATRIQGALAPELCTPATIPECLTLAQSWFASGFARAFLEVRGEEAMDRGTEEAAAAVKVCRGPALPGDT